MGSDWWVIIGSGSSDLVLKKPMMILFIGKYNAPPDLSECSHSCMSWTLYTNIYFYWYLSMQLFSKLFLKKLNAIPNII